ncbi:MAG TPA: hypothetical protein VFB72_07545 [Verrucomicrobiae bacterium]|nr:hypothetical protein [Verrucomicrobiae bacterium]
MRKIRSDALWHKLSPEQQKKIERWFFDEHLSYRVVRERLRTDFGVTCALSAIGPMYRHCKELRSRERDATLDRLTEILTDPRSDLRRIPTDSVATITACLMHRAIVQDDPKTVAALANVIMQGQSHEIQRDHKKLAEEKLAFRRLQFAVSSGAIGSKEILMQLGDTIRQAQAPLSDTKSPKPGLYRINRDKK